VSDIIISAAGCILWIGLIWPVVLILVRKPSEIDEVRYEV